MQVNVEIEKFTLEAQKVGTVQIGSTFLATEAHPQMVKNYAVAIQKNLRQWSASTKGRSEVNHSGQKPHAQKGTGKARQGYLGTPQYKGGGVVFGPKPKFNQHVRINQKERRACIRHLLAQKMKDGTLLPLEDPTLSEPKTTIFAKFLRNLSLTGKILFILPNKNRQKTLGDPHHCKERAQNEEALCKSVRNIPKVSITNLASLNGVDLLLAKQIVILQTALTELIGAEGD